MTHAILKSLWRGIFLQYYSFLFLLPFLVWWTSRRQWESLVDSRGIRVEVPVDEGGGNVEGVLASPCRQGRLLCPYIAL